MALQDVESRGSTSEVTPRRIYTPEPKSRVTVARRRRRVSTPTRTRTRTRTYRPEVTGRQHAIQRRSTRTNERAKVVAKPVTKPVTAKVVKPPLPPGVNTYLAGDSTYQRQLAQFAKSLSDFKADQGLATTDYNTGYQNTYRDIGLAKTDALKDLENDYASRGMLRSNLYSGAMGDLTGEYQNQYTDLGKQRTSFLDQLQNELLKFQNEQTGQTQNARAEAIRRRAERYNL